MGVHSKRKKWIIKDPLPTRLRWFFHRNITCRLIGHDTIVKMDGTKLCRRH
jgi:hypothetical protein